MKLLLVGPYPPPHGGVSVHVRSLRRRMEEAGVECGVLNIEPGAPESDQYIKARSGIQFAKELVRHSWNGWTMHVHTNGHNRKSWLVALACGLAAQIGPGCRLTLHSGILPGYLNGGSPFRRVLARLTCRLCDRIICVNQEIRTALAGLGVPKQKLEVKEAFLGRPVSNREVPPVLAAWMKTRSPLLTTTMFMRPEYGYGVLQAALSRLRSRYPRIGCIVMGVDGIANDERVWHAGDVDHGVCMALMSKSDVFVRPTFNDGDSISVREAQAAGVPVIASNVGTRPPGTILFEPGDVEGLVERLDSVLTALSPPERALEFGHSGRASIAGVSPPGTGGVPAPSRKMAPQASFDRRRRGGH